MQTSEIYCFLSTEVRAAEVHLFSSKLVAFHGDCCKKCQEEVHWIWPLSSTELNANVCFDKWARCQMLITSLMAGSEVAGAD